MHISSAHKKRLAQVARIATAGAMVVSSLSVALTSPVSAAALTANETRISDSRPSPGSANVTYTISFTPSITTTTVAAVEVQFCTTANTFGVSCTAPSGLVYDDSATETASGFAGGAGNAGTFSQQGANVVRYVTGQTGGTLETAVPHTLTLTNAMTNPTSAGTYFARVRTYSDASATLPLDDGTSAFAIVQSVVVSGRVLETMSFTVNGTAASTQCGTGDTTSSDVVSTNLAVPFGNFNSGNARVGCQVIATSTNAVGGYTTSLRQYTSGASPVGAMCRQTTGTCTEAGAQAGATSANAIVNTLLDNTPSAWDAGTYGLGINANGTQKAVAFVNATDYRGFYDGSSNSEPVVVALSGAPTTATNTYITFRADVSPTQTAGVYQNRLMYISTPTF